MQNENETQPEPQSEIHFSNYIYILKKHRTNIVTIFCLIVLITAVFTFTSTPIYQAQAKVVIDEERRLPLGGMGEVDTSFLSQQLTFKTHFQLITSRPVIEAVLRRVKLPESALDSGPIAKYWQAITKNIVRLIGASIGSEPSIVSKDSVEDELNKRIEYLLDKIKISEVRNTRLLTVAVQDANPRLAQQLANAVADAYIEYDSEMRIRSSRQMVQWLSDQLYEVRKEAEDAEAKFLQLKEKEGVFSIEEKRKRSVQSLDEVNAELVKTKSKILEVEARINELKQLIRNDKSGSLGVVPTFLQNQFLASLYSELLTAEVDRKGLSSVFKSKHPEMIKVNNKIQELRNKMSHELRKALADAMSEREVLLARVKMLTEILVSYEKDAIGTGKQELRYASLEREVSTSRDVYNTLLMKVKETDVLDGVLKSNLRLVEPASLPEKPIKPRKFLNLALATVLGLLLGVVSAFGKEYLDRTIRNKEEVDRFIGAAVLAQIPMVNKKGTLGNKPSSKMPSLANFPLTSVFFESYRVLTTNLKFLNTSNRRSVYLITSTSPKEGKTTTCYNLGSSIAYQNHRTLIIDCDLRIPALTKHLNFLDAEGLTNIMVDILSTNVNKGVLGRMTVSDLHRLIQVQGRTGLLEYSAGEDFFKISFSKGTIVDVTWSTRPGNKRLGSLLLKSGKIDSEQAKLALEIQKSTGKKLGQVLLELGFASAETLAGPLRLQIEEGLRELCKHEDAHYHFKESHHLFSICEHDPAEAALSKAVGHIEDDIHTGSPYIIEEFNKRLKQVNANLWFLPSGETPPNPAELLSSQRLPVLIEMLREHFDYIFLDSPPLGSVDDATNLSRIADGTILVVAAGSTRIEQVRNSVDRLRLVDSPLIGLVLNKVEKRHDPAYYSNYSKKYSYYYQKQGTKAA